ncbi:MAG: ATP-binding protein, partial [Bacteroidota bacterium]
MNCIPLARTCKSYSFLFILFMMFGVSAHAWYSHIDSLLMQTAGMEESRMKVRKLNELAWEYNKIDIKKLEFYAKKALNLALKLDDHAGVSRAKNLIAIAVSAEGKTQESIELNLEALRIAEHIGDCKLMGGASNDLGVLYSELRDDERAIFYYKKTVESSPDHEYIAFTYSNIAVTYFQLGEIQAGRKYLTEAIKAASESNKDEIKAHMHLNVGDLLFRLDKLKEAACYYQKADSLAEAQGNIAVRRRAHMSMVNICLEKEEFKKARRKFRQAMAFNKTLKEKEGPELLNISAYLNMKLGNYEKAQSEGEAALKAAKETNNKYILSNIYTVLSELYRVQANYKKAYHMKELELELVDSMYTEKSTKTLHRLETRFELKEKERENHILLKEAEAKGNKILMMRKMVDQQRLTTTFIVAGLFITALLLFYVYRLLKTLRIKNKQLLLQSDKLRAAKSKAESAAQAKAEFMSVMSHEIRTPINAVIGMTHLLLDETPRKDQEEYLNTLQFSGNNLLSIVNDILDFSKIEAGKLQLEKITFDLKDLVQSICSSMRIKGEDKGLDVRFVYDPKLSHFFIGDSVRLAQILINLMGNAIKFTEKGFVELRVTQATSGSLCFSVIDSGIGIAEEKQAMIFNAFSQSNIHTTRKFGGTGLGLSISKKLVELMGSELQLISNLGEGSMFFFEVKMLQTHTHKLKEQTKKRPSKLAFGSLNGMKVLLAEDNKTNQLVAKKFLERWDIQVEVVENGRQAVHAWRKGQFDLILMDVQMPLMTGIEASQLIRKEEQKTGNRIPIIGFTACVIPDEVSKVLEAGMDDWVGKPFDPAVFH